MIRKGNGNPFQYSRLENSVDRGAWRAQSRRSQRVRHDWVRMCAEKDILIVQISWGSYAQVWELKKEAEPADFALFSMSVKFHWRHGRKGQAHHRDIALRRQPSSHSRKGRGDRAQVSLMQNWVAFLTSNGVDTRHLGEKGEGHEGSVGPLLTPWADAPSSRRHRERKWPTLKALLSSQHPFSLQKDIQVRFEAKERGP